MEQRPLPESTKTPYYPALDGLRTIAVAMVFGVHFLPTIFPYGWLGVQIFFVLSGFLITGILFDTRLQKHRYKNFYVRRALRIFPLYYGVLFVCSAVVILGHGQTPHHLWLWFVYLQNFFWISTHGGYNDFFLLGGHGFASIGHFWSLAVEEQFYLVWPPLVFFVHNRRRLMQLCCALIVFRLLLAAYWQMHLSPETLTLGITYRMLPTQWDGFLMGGLLALWLRGTPSPRVLNRAGLTATIAVLLYGCLLAVLHLRPELIGGQQVFDFASGFQATVGMPLSNLVSTCLLLAVLQPGTWIWRLCHLASMRSLGRVSYGLYVFHEPIYVVTGGATLCVYNHLTASLQPWGHFVEATLLTGLLSYASFHLYEKHFLLLKNRFTSVHNLSERRPALHPRKRLAEDTL